MRLGFRIVLAECTDTRVVFSFEVCIQRTMQVSKKRVLCYSKTFQAYVPQCIILFKPIINLSQNPTTRFFHSPMFRQSLFALVCNPNLTLRIGLILQYAGVSILNTVSRYMVLFVQS